MINKKRQTPLDLIFDHVQNPGDFLRTLFDKNTIREDEMRGGNRTKKISFNYNIFNPKINVREEMFSNYVLSNLIINIQKYPWEGHKLLTHPLLESFIIKKWEKVKIFFNSQAFITLLFVILLSFMTTWKCGRETKQLDRIDTIWFLLPLIPMLLEIIIFEIFLLIKQHSSGKLLLILFKLIAISMAILSLIFYDECNDKFRHVSLF